MSLLPLLLKVNCTNIFNAKLSNDPNPNIPPMWHQLSREYQNAFTYNGSVTVKPFYFDERELGSDIPKQNTFSKDEIQRLSMIINVFFKCHI